MLPSQRNGEILSGDSDRVMAAFQETMRTFLKVQRTTMTAYLAGKQSPSSRQMIGPGALPKTAPERSSSPPAAAEPTPSSGPGRIRLRFAGGPGSSARGSHPRFRGPRPDRQEAARRLSASGPVIPWKCSSWSWISKRTWVSIPSSALRSWASSRDAFPQLRAGGDGESMEGLSSATTLAAIVDRALRAIDKTGETAPPRSVARVEAARNGKPHGGALRMLLEPVACPIDGMETGLMSGGTVLITDDGRGVALDLADRISSRGWRVSVIGGPESPIDWTSPAAVEAAVRNERRDGPITALVHLLPLRAARHPGTDPEAWAERMTVEVKGLFLLAKEVAADLDLAAGRGGACLIGVTAMGGRFASAGGDPEDLFAGQGAVAGLIRRSPGSGAPSGRALSIPTSWRSIADNWPTTCLPNSSTTAPGPKSGTGRVSASGCGRCPHRCRKATVVLSSNCRPVSPC